MSVGLRLEMRQGQQLVMTPQLQQAIRLLTLSNLELTAFVAAEVERNPLLELDDGLGSETAPAQVVRAQRTDERLGDGADPGLAAEIFDTGSENLYDTARADGAGDAATGMAAGPAEMSGLGTADSPADNPAASPGASPAGGPSGGAAGGSAGNAAGGPEGDWDIGERLSAAPDLRAHLTEQIGRMRATAAEHRLASAIAGFLDDDGLLRADPAEVAAAAGVDESHFAAALALVQACEPTGVGARGLAECLALQLAERRRLDPAMQVLLERLDLLARGDLARLRRLCGVDEEDFAGMLADLRALDPRPGAAFSAEPSPGVVPDVFVRRAPGGGWQVELNTDTLPRVLVDRAYAAELDAAGAVTREFLSTCRENANWLLRSLDQRARTILHVVSEIVAHQDAFFRDGEIGLRPLTLQMVAEAVGRDESIISRVTANKYVATERGVFLLKRFFTNAVGQGEGTSATSVRARIRRMIETETADSVLSDDQIVETLKTDGIDIARRTVAKYRKCLGIASSVERRRRHLLRDAG